MRKAEIEAVESLLQEPAEDSIELASRIIKALDAVRSASEQPYHVAIAVTPGATEVIQAFGPVAGKTAALRAAAKLPRIETTRLVVAPMYGVKYAEQLLERVDGS